MKSKTIFIIGALILLAGFVYDIAFLNIPPQDPPQWVIDERHEMHDALNLIYAVGGSTLVVGAIISAIRKIKTQNSTRHHTN